MSADPPVSSSVDLRFPILLMAHEHGQEDNVQRDELKEGRAHREVDAGV